MLRGGYGKLAFDRDGLGNSLRDLLKGLVEIYQLRGQTVPRGNDILERRQRTVACFGQQSVQSVLVRLDYFLVVLISFEERIAPLGAVFIEVFIADISQFLIILLFGDLPRFLLKLELRFFLVVACETFPLRLLRRFFLLFELLFICLLLLLGQAVVS